MSILKEIDFNAYTLVIGGSLIIIISYFFNVIARKTNIPSVLMLILLGIIIKQGMVLADKPDVDFFPVLEILGIVGLIMIVLEAALDLELKKEKWPIIWKSFLISLLSLVFCAVIIAWIIQLFFDTDLFTGLLYALPFSIMSSAIVIPSVENLSEHKKEFMIYESTFSDILGIMAFYFLLGSVETNSVGELTWKIAGNIFVTVLISIIVSYGLIIMFQYLKSHVKLFLIISILLVLYSVGKLMHLSSLILILMFGLVLQNRKLFFRGFMKKYINTDVMNDIYKNFKLVTLETSFVVRTFFFVIFGMSIALISLLSIKVLIISGLILGVLFAIRILLLLLFDRKDIIPQVFLAPRGLITILLFYSIPVEYQINNFKPGILLFVILVSSVLMAWALIKHKKTEQIKREIETDFPENNIQNPAIDGQPEIVDK
ncbi:MAG: hypothetical protein Kow0068_06120 [Marinilabiliales bacterium]